MPIRAHTQPVPTIEHASAKALNNGATAMSTSAGNQLGHCAPIPELEYIADFFDAEESEFLFNSFRHRQWPSNRYEYSGRQFVLPRLQTWHADAGIRYSYSNNLLKTTPWTPVLLDIRVRLEQYLNAPFNSVLANYYRDGHDFVGWHADDEAELGEAPLIASVTFGSPRWFAYKQKTTGLTGRFILDSGSLLVMKPAFQRHWWHSVPKDKHVSEGRINLTFRHVFNLKAAISA